MMTAKVVGSTFGIKRKVDPKYISAKEKRELDARKNNTSGKWFVCGVNADDVPEWEVVNAPTEWEAVKYAEDEFNWDNVNAFAILDFCIGRVTKMQHERGIYETDAEILKGGLTA